MIINKSNLGIVFTGFKTAFNRGLGQSTSQYALISTPVPSSTSEEKYGWLGKFPNFKEWLGDRVVENVRLHDYAIRNRKFENTIAVDKDSIQDDQYGVFAPMFEEMGMATAAHPDQLVWPLLKAGFDGSRGLAYDGQFFFDTDHPALDENGAEISIANTDGGAGTPWFLMCLNRPLKPIIWQTRRPYDLKRKDRPEDDNVFDRDEFVYGVDARVNAGFALWQLCWGSKQTLNKANYQIAREALIGMKGDYGRPLGLMPTHLVVPPSLEFNALEILNAERDAAGATNVYKGTATPMVVPWLA
ncbi:MAG: hypothetical protein HKM95_14630 [Inquilinus sp.]|nr:hypothetical protein [Inquilinus sp.]